MLRMFKANDDTLSKKALMDPKETNKATPRKEGAPLTKSASTRITQEGKNSPVRSDHAVHKRTKSSPTVVSQSHKAVPPPRPKHKTQIAIRLNQAAQKHSQTSGRSQDVVSLMKDCDLMCKNLHELIESARQYQQSLIDLEANRTTLYHKMATLSGDTQLTQVVGTASNATSVNTLKGTLVTLEERFSKASQKHANSYQEMVIDYAVEWESIIRSMTETEVGQSRKLHKVVQHYEDKVDKLRKAAQNKENQGKVSSPSQAAKLTRNETKLAKAWQDYDAAATRTANLLEQATRVGYRDLHPLVQAMITFELERDRDERNTWHYVGKIQDQLVAIMAENEEPPLPPPVTPPHHEHAVDTTERTEPHIDDSSDPDEEDSGSDVSNKATAEETKEEEKTPEGEVCL